jgi:hypothetical protein
LTTEGDGDCRPLKCFAWHYKCQSPKVEGSWALRPLSHVPCPLRLCLVPPRHVQGPITVGLCGETFSSPNSFSSVPRIAYAVSKSSCTHHRCSVFYHLLSSTTLLCNIIFNSSVMKAIFTPTSEQVDSAVVHISVKSMSSLLNTRLPDAVKWSNAVVSSEFVAIA